MQAKRGQTDIDMSEPEFLIRMMERHQDWCVIVCLIGGGQGINTGEAGLSEWLQALETQFENWDVYISDRISDADDAADETTRGLVDRLTARACGALHLGVSMRFFRAEALSSFVGHVVEGRAGLARQVYEEIAEQ